MSTDTPIKIHTLKEAAGILGVGYRWLYKFLRDNPAPAGHEPYYRQGGRAKILDFHDLQRIKLRLIDHDFAKRTPKSLNYTRGKIYFVQAGEFIKIGWALDPHKRIAHMQTGSAYEFKLLGLMHGSLIEEKIVHKRFSAFRVRGEWFKQTPELNRYIRAVRIRRTA